MQIGLEEKDTLPKLSSKKKQITDSDFQAKVKNLPKEIPPFPSNPPPV